MTQQDRSITVFAIPKAFEGHVGVIQRNAIRSWAKLGLSVILMGDDPGVREMAQEVGATFLPDVDRNEFGTPLLDSAFRQAKSTATTDIIAYVNSDIIFVDPLPQAIKGLEFASFLAVGQRTNIDLNSEIDFSQADWRNPVRELVRSSGVLFGPMAMDYFILPRQSPLTELPPFAVGRPGWDNWMCARAWDCHVPLVDLTNCLLAVHQEHGYEHVKQRTGKKWRGPEGDENHRLAAGLPTYQGIEEATQVADEAGRIQPNHLTIARMYWRTTVRRRPPRPLLFLRVLPLMIYHITRRGQLAALIRRKVRRQKRK